MRRLELAVLQFAVVEQPREHLHHRLARLLRLLDQPLVAGRHVALSQQRQRSEHAVQRVAQLVAHHRQEPRLGPARLLGLQRTTPVELGDLALTAVLTQDQEQREHAEPDRGEADRHRRLRALLDAVAHLRRRGGVAAHHPQGVEAQVVLKRLEFAQDGADADGVVRREPLKHRIELAQILLERRDRSVAEVVAADQVADPTGAHHEHPAPQDVEPFADVFQSLFASLDFEIGDAELKAQKLDLHLGRSPQDVVLADDPKILDVTSNRIVSDRGEARHRQQNNKAEVSLHQPRHRQIDSILITCQINRWM